MSIIILLTAIGFAVVILFLRGGLYKLDCHECQSANDKGGGPIPPPCSVDKGTSFSIIIAARNEERNIGACLQSVFAQDIRADKYEVIVIDDRSEDATPKILNELSSHYPNLKIITITQTPPGISPKKHAVTAGIKSASNDIIVFTDADCKVQPQWLSTISKYFEDENTALVQGITSYHYIPGMSKLFWGLQSVDFISHGIIAAAAIGADLPINSNANNMAFRKKAFEEIGGYGDDSSVALGDDDQLLQKVWETSRGGARSYKIRYMADPLASVETAPTQTIAALFEQRRRWGSVTVHYKKRQTALLAAVFIFYMTIPIAAIMALFDASYFYICASLLLVKLCGELVLMIPGTRIFNKKHLRKYIIPASLIQLPTVLTAVISGVFGKFDWKGQKMRHRVRGGFVSATKSPLDSL